MEYEIPSAKSLVSQMLVPDSESEQALSLAMRADPDVVLMGECIRAAHFEGCMRLASTGHLVLTTVHAINTVSACERVAAACGSEGRLALSQTLKAVISQQLLESSRRSDSQAHGRRSGDHRSCHEKPSSPGRAVRSDPANPGKPASRHGHGYSQLVGGQKKSLIPPL